MSIFNFFVPNRQQVSAITNANPGVVTTTQDHGYETGYEVRFFFPLNVGMNQLSDQVVKITKIDDTSFSIGIDTRNFDAFSPVGTVQLPQVIPVGSFQNSVLEPTENNGNIIPQTSWIQE
jgi:hypothetical protein